MTTPQDPNGGDSDWGRRPPVGGWGAVGPADPTADPETPALGIPAVGNEAETPRHGWDPAASDWNVPVEDPAPRTDPWPAAGEATGALPVAEPGSGTGGWSATGVAGAGGWPEGDAESTGRRRAAAPADEPGATGAWPAGQTAGWSATGAQPAGEATGGWSPTEGRGTGGTGGWDPAGGSGDRAGATGATAVIGPPGSRRRSAGGRSVTLLAIAGVVLIVVLAVVGVVGFWKPGYFLVEQFDQQALQSGVTQVLTQDYGLDATDVVCPGGQRVTPGAEFRCSATVDGENVQVPVTVLDAQGTYRVGRV